MADERLPEEMISWMNQRGWGEHHNQWHFQRRWDFWRAMAAQPEHPTWVDELIAEASAKGLDDETSAYKERLNYYVKMMNQEMHHHLANAMRATARRKTRNIFALDVPQRRLSAT